MECDWMASIEDGRGLNTLTILGTHDSATYHTYQWRMFGYIKTQTLSIKEQLEIGCRFLDIRLAYSHGRLKVQHDKYFLHCYFEDILAQCVKFLDTYSSETIIMSIRREIPDVPSDRCDNFITTLMKMIDSKYWCTDKDFPNLGAARGKIVLLRRYDNPDLKDLLGINISSIADNQIGSFEFGDFHNVLYYEDVYNLSNVEEKRDNLLKFYNDYYVPNFGKTEYFLAFTSGYIRKINSLYTPKALARHINSWFLTHIITPYRPRAIFPMDFVTPDLGKAMVAVNFP